LARLHASSPTDGVAIRKASPNPVAGPENTSATTFVLRAEVGAVRLQGCAMAQVLGSEIADCDPAEREHLADRVAVKAEGHGAFDGIGPARVEAVEYQFVLKVGAYFGSPQLLPEGVQSARTTLPKADVRVPGVNPMPDLVTELRTRRPRIQLPLLSV